MFLVPDSVVRFFHRMASPPHFYAFTERLMPWMVVIFVLLVVSGLYGGLYLAPADYQQGDSYRIIYIHVPSAWMSLFIYVVMAVAGGIGLIWRIKLAEIVMISSASVGASFTFIALVTGSLWGKPMWGTWWVWDARLTSELILLFLYLGVAILALVGVVNIPIIHYSVEWWNTLHQGPTVTKMDKPSIHVTMLVPLLLMALAFKVYYLIAMILRARVELLQRERNSQWVKIKAIEEGRA
jgi:heme exporter protein C